MVKSDNRKKTITKKILISTTAVLLSLIAIIIFVYVYWSNKDPNPNRPLHIDNSTSMVQAYGRNIYDENGDLLLLKGVNLGNWFVQEYWMCPSSVGNFETGVYTQKRGLEAMQANPNLSDQQIEELNELYINTFIQESDFETIAEIGLNCVRVNFTYMNLTTDGSTLKDDAFDHLDWVLEMCEKYGLYAILDLHGAIGSQNKDHHSGNDADFDLYGNQEHMDMTKDLWVTIANRYKDSTVVAAYDLINETRSAPDRYSGKVQFDFYDVLYKAIRAVDANHMIMIECFTFPIHGVSEKTYNWENVCYEYHIYNLTAFSQQTCLNFYKALHNIMGYDVPVYIGEWCAWGKEADWTTSLNFFEELGWSYSSWTYKTNRKGNWGLYELNLDPVDISTATYEEIAAVWGATGSENAEKTFVYDLYKNRYSS